MFERRLTASGRAPVAAPAEPPPELQLVSDDVISDRINVDRLIGRARSRLDPDEVLGIRARLGALLEQHWFDETRHPAAPEAVFEALRTALAELSLRPEVRVALLDAFEPHVGSGPPPAGFDPYAASRIRGWRSTARWPTRPQAGRRGVRTSRGCCPIPR